MSIRLSHRFPTPLYTTVQRDALSSPRTGFIIYNTTDDELQYYDGTIWQTIDSSGSTPWATSWSRHFLVMGA